MSVRRKWIDLLLVLAMAASWASALTDYTSLGCWKLNSKQSIDNAIPDLTDDSQANLYTDTTTVSSCAQLAKNHGYSFFGVRDHNQCVSGVHAGFTYSKHGPSSLCRGGTGGPGAVDVYSFQGSGLVDVSQIDTTESRFFPQDKQYLPSQPFIQDHQYLPSQDRSFILKPQTVQTQSADPRNSLLAGALTSSLYLNGQVQPVNIDPLFHEVDEFKYGGFIPIPKGTNILTNPGFELSINTSPLVGWSCQGQTDDPRGGALSKYSLDRKEGQYSGICYARLAEWAGPGQYIGRKVKPNGVYSFSGWTKLLDPKHTRDLHTLELWLRFKRRDESKENTMLLARRDLLSIDDGWVHWRTAFEIPDGRKGFRYIFIFFRGPNKSVDIVADDMKLIEMYQDPDWKRKTDLLIEKYRKRKLKIRVNVPPNSLPQSHMGMIEIKVEQLNHKFGFGAVANTDNLVNNQKYREFFLRNFDWAVMENAMKWPQNEPRRGFFTYKDAEKTLAILEKHNKTLRGHCVYWAVQEQLPKWIHSLPKPQLFESMKMRLRGLLERYHGRFKHWDVNNEMLHGRFFAERLGKPIREWMFKSAAELDPDADLFINDFDVVENGQLTELLVEQAKELIQRGVNIDGVGVQGHFTGRVNPFLIRLRLNALSEIGRPIWLTEVDILDKNVNQRADSLEAIMRMSFSHPNVSGIVLWSFWAKSSWRGPDVALVDADWKLNAAGERYFQLLDSWTTSGTVNPTKIDEHGGEVLLAGFHGDYLVTVTLPNGNFVKKRFTLEPGNDVFNLQLNMVPRPPLTLSDFNVISRDKDFSKLMWRFENKLKNLLERPDMKVEPDEPDQSLPDV